jgi:hypothetical protein
MCQVPCATEKERPHMFHKLEIFLSKEDGAVTVDWVVLTAAVCGLAIASFAAIQQGGESVSGNVETYLLDTSVEEIAGLE